MIAVKAFFLYLQLTINACEAIKLGTIGANMGLIDKVIADWTGKDFYQASILFCDWSR